MRAIHRARNQGQTECPLCRVILDYTVSQTPASAEVDHIESFASTGKVAPPIDEVRVICRKCNQTLGGKQGAAVRHGKAQELAFPLSRSW